MLQSKWLSSGVCLLVVADINLLKIAVFRFTRDTPLVQPFFWCLVSGAWIIKPLYLCLMILISVTLILKELSFYAGVIFDSYQKLHVLVKNTLIVSVCFPRNCFFLENFVYLCAFLQTFISEFAPELNKYVLPLLEWACLSATGVVVQLGPTFLKKTFFFRKLFIFNIFPK